MDSAAPATDAAAVAAACEEEPWWASLPQQAEELHESAARQAREAASMAGVAKGILGLQRLQGTCQHCDAMRQGLDLVMLKWREQAARCAAAEKLAAELSRQRDELITETQRLRDELRRARSLIATAARAAVEEEQQQ
eukprot:TRINITY_DN10595_c0_g1_i11.p1 TRINITY_DN10595_c0_g1~~TRINITY_DN10595_c0_g1_i11.p1  ORF type:complete len:149 (+),score=53.76 TRINITY_DN10595_c0_g1_i11:36-449(+)